MEPKEIFSAFADVINEHSLNNIMALMSDDHIFIDAHGNQMNKEQMEAGWKGYFNWFPDYKIEITAMFSEDNSVAAFGFGGGTFKGAKQHTKENHWRLPAAWKAIVENGKIKVWQVFADSKVPFEIITKQTRQSL